ncbi:hypothetical protein J2S74_000774 [Evansella vedderi]|uniref:DUF4145 domain-containing protein n=1 Tax=Evansella vedderi TaxID=38282 RepID=A0ABT9ZQ85_9BACI|nr:DUF4145 domain-containing protein [Evansella vedderi]MDQ0253402.1 hypothetical protein [Evansella vedderi]
MGKGNFDFLAKKWNLLAEIGQMAEKHVVNDPNTTLVKLRMFGETVTAILNDLEKIPRMDIHPQYKRIKRLLSKDIISYEIYDKLQFLRIRGNRAVHNAKYGTSEEAEDALNQAFQLGVWLMRVYGQWDFKEPKYIEPQGEVSPIKTLSPPPSKTREQKLIKVQKDKIKERPTIQVKIHKYSKDEQGYETWLEENYTGYVFNYFGGTNSSKGMNKIHRADCRFLMRKQDKGKRTTIPKVCSKNKDELIEYVTHERGNSWEFCKSCF